MLPAVAGRRSAAAALPEWIQPQLTQLVDAAPDGDEWLHEIKFDGYRMERKTIELFHRLQVHISERMPGTQIGTGWTLADDRTCAIWDKGFQAFLNTPREMRDVLTQLRC